MYPPGHRSTRNFDPASMQVGAEAHMRRASDVKKVGGTGTNARSREIDVEGGCDGINSESRDQMARPASEQGTQGFLGPLAKCHPVLLPLGAQDRVDKTHRCAVDHTGFCACHAG